jgi:hypothetical protein
MQNDPELDGKYLGTISKDFIIVSDSLKEASYQIRDREFSNYPIFPIQKFEVPHIGQLLIAKEEVGAIWNYNASFLDEFIQRNIITKEKEQEFIATFKDPDEFCCLFVIDGNFTRFVFIPYPID